MADRTDETPKETEELESELELESCLQDLSLTNKRPEKDVPRPIIKRLTKPKKDTVVIAESWEDEVDSGPETEKEEVEASSTFLSPSETNEGPLAPPPTPISPQTSRPWVSTSDPPYANTPLPAVSDSRTPAPPRVRPAKQTAVAARLIAGGLGLRVPKRTEEQRAYDRAIKEQEIKRRNREKEEAAKAKEEEERAKTAVWDG